eukprot:CAMPEP_0176454022 /NCGR_PEP_ID=MMETSP0127-20121128/29652_1 /TAXON_ID=938130 /ORGANISM="Platyophrya macrostoma, Strain WH" /LENGTH=57 /DNA_ID=CAMNT_0017843125 /DNA_START=1 /DNA_END=171 /DNA_ORIENTATION=+
MSTTTVTPRFTFCNVNLLNGAKFAFVGLSSSAAALASNPLYLNILNLVMTDGGLYFK